MPSNPLEPRPASVALEIKSGSITLPILKLLSADLGLVRAQLEQKLVRAPEFFRNVPLVIELGELRLDGEALDFPALLALLRELALSPVGLRGGDPAQQRVAREDRLAVLAEIKADPAAAPPAKPGAETAAPAVPLARGANTKLIEHPVRSGQRIYAAGGDLIVLAQVSPGAEIMADGHIHVYGSLKGRALAGVQGNLDARIFCADLQAELLAIGGHYKLSENLGEVPRGKPVQAYLRNDALIVEHL